MEFKEAVLFIIVFMLLLIFVGLRNQNEQRKRRRRILKDKWGCMADKNYTDVDYEKIEYFFYNHKKDIFVDDITWNDLSMDGIFERMDTTSSSIGREYLYSMLRELSTDVDELKKRDAIMEYVSSNEDIRLDIQEKLQDIGDYSKISIYKYLEKVNKIKKKSPIKHILQDVIFVGAVCLVINGVSAGISIGLLFASLMYNIFTYYKEKSAIDGWLGLFAYIIRAEINAREIVKIIEQNDIKVLDEEKNALSKITDSLKSLRRGVFILAGNSNITKSIVDVLMDYIKMLTHIDIMKFYAMLNTINNNKEKIEELYKNIGYIDSLCAAASFRCALGNYSKPEFVSSNEIIYDAKGLFHPLLTKPVKNSICEDKSVLITGSNASGKSTFIKTLAINALFSQTIYTSVSDYYKGCFFSIYSSMALKDDIFSSESYYIVEIKSLKRIMDSDKEKIPVLCFVDEVLRGTNTLERIAASSEILLNLSKQNVMCFAATHDIELTYILKNYYNNYHFHEEVIDDDVKFDYKLYKGPATSRNAIKLLNMIGYSKDIVNRAQRSADKFLEDGIWKVYE